MHSAPAEHHISRRLQAAPGSIVFRGFCDLALSVITKVKPDIPSSHALGRGDGDDNRAIRFGIGQAGGKRQISIKRLQFAIWFTFAFAS